MPPRGGFDLAVYIHGDAGAEGVRVRNVSQAPEGGDFLGGEGANFGEVEVGGEGFDGGFGGWVGR